MATDTDVTRVPKLSRGSEGKVAILRKSAIAWRILAAACVLLGGSYAVIRSVAIVVVRGDPLLAASLSGNDARIAGKAAESLIPVAQNAADRQAASELARRALLRDGTAVSGVVAMGTFAGLNGDETAAARWFRYSQQLSRRDLPTQLFLIEDSVQRGNVADAVDHYDIALRTGEDTVFALLFPVLRSSITSADVRPALARKMAGNNAPWVVKFLVDVAVNGSDPVSAAQFFSDVERYGTPVHYTIRNTLLGRLVGQGSIDIAWKYYLRDNPGSDRQLIRNADFQSDSPASGPFDWQLSNGDGVTVTLDQSGQSRILNYEFASTVGGMAARQMLLLQAGKYRLTTTSLQSSQPLGRGAFWKLECVDGTSVTALELGAGARKFETEFVMPAGCNAQWLSLMVRASDDINGSTGQVDSVSITKEK